MRDSSVQKEGCGRPISHKMTAAATKSTSKTTADTTPRKQPSRSPSPPGLVARQGRIFPRRDSSVGSQGTAAVLLPFIANFNSFPIPAPYCRSLIVGFFRAQRLEGSIKLSSRLRYGIKRICTRAKPELAAKTKISQHPFP